MIEWSPIILTFKLAAITTVILFIIALPFSYYLAYSNHKIKPFLETMISMPLVLPPTVIGFYLLLAFSPQNFFGNWLEEWFGFRLAFSFEGLVFASLLYSMPFMVHPLQSGLSNLPKNLLEASRILGKSDIITFFKVQLPNIKPSIITACVLTFAHTVGKFGVVLMIGGNIPDKTRVASIAIYDEVETLNYGAANIYSLILFAFSFIFLLVVYFFNRKYLKSYW